MNVDAARHDSQPENSPRGNTAESGKVSPNFEMLLRVPQLNRVDSVETSSTGQTITSNLLSEAGGQEVDDTPADAPQTSSPPTVAESQPALGSKRETSLHETSRHETGLHETGEVPEAVNSTAPSVIPVWKSRWNAVTASAKELPAKVQAFAGKVKLPKLSGPVAGAAAQQDANPATSRMLDAWNSNWKVVVGVAAAVVFCVFVARAMKRERPHVAETQQLARQADAAAPLARSTPARNASAPTERTTVADRQTNFASGRSASQTATPRQADSPYIARNSPPVSPSNLAGGRRFDFEMRPSNQVGPSADSVQAPPSTVNGSGPGTRTTPVPSAQSARQAGTSQSEGGFYHDVATNLAPLPQSSARQINESGRFDRAHAALRSESNQYVEQGRMPVPPSRSQWTRNGDLPNPRPELELNRPGQLPKPPGPAYESRRPVERQQLPSRRDGVDGGLESRYPSTNPATFMYHPGDFQQIRTSLLRAPGGAQSANWQTNPDNGIYHGNRPPNQRQATQPSSSGVYR